MEKLKKHPLFKGFSEKEFLKFISKLKTISLQEKEIFITPGKKMDHVYMVVSGKMEIYNFDIHGNKKIITILKKGDFFGESKAFGNQKRVPFYVESTEDSIILPLSTHYLMSPEHPSILMYNLIQALAIKNEFLVHKIECLDKTSIEERVFEVLNYHRIEQNSLSVVLPFNKTKLAEYLSVNRSALSREMSSMEKKGIFKCHKNSYRLNPKYFHHDTQ